MSTSVRQILVHVDPTRTAGHRLALARQAAQAQGAALAALYAVTPSVLALPYAPDLSASVAASLAEFDAQRLAAARAAFELASAAPGASITWAQTDEVPVAAAFARQALYADLLVLGQRDAADPDSGCVPPDFCESVLLASGKPAIIVPFIGWSGTIGATVVIAWKASRESARAVAAALPLLQRANQVHVLTWGDAEPNQAEGQALGLEGWLRLHGVQATWHHGGPEPQALGELFLSRAFDLDADLLVMGCYGHSRAREWVLGGASRSVLQAMTLPVLMSH